MNGGVPKDRLTEENLEALGKGLENLKRHITNMRNFGLPVVVALNRFDADTEAEIRTVIEKCAHRGVDVVETRVWEDGGEGGEKLAMAVIRLIEERPADFRFLYADDLPLTEKIEKIAREIYGARDVDMDKKTAGKLRQLEDDGYGSFPVCMAKTQYSFSSDPGLLGAPKDFTLHVRDVKLAAGAEFVIVYCGDILTLPGLPRVPSAEKIDVDANGKISGLF